MVSLQVRDVGKPDRYFEDHGHITHSYKVALPTFSMDYPLPFFLDLLSKYECGSCDHTLTSIYSFVECLPR